jgi:hypothetical protein
VDESRSSKIETSFRNVLELCVYEEIIPDLLGSICKTVWHWRCGARKGTAANKEDAMRAVVSAAARRAALK